MVEGPSQTPQIEDLRSSLRDNGYTVVPLGSENVKGLAQEIMVDPKYGSISGTGRFNNLLFQEVTVFYDKDKIKPIEFPHFSVGEEEKKERYNREVFMTFSSGFPIVYIDVQTDEGKAEKRTVYFRPKEKDNDNDLTRQTA